MPRGSRSPSSSPLPGLAEVPGELADRRAPQCRRCASGAARRGAYPRSVSTRPRPRPWLVLWLWLAVPFLLVAAAVIALPMAFEETRADRADAVASLWPPVVALLALAALAAAAGWRASRRHGAETAGLPPS